jgi:ABC-2 type transport system ATP-binding protein
VSQDASAAIMVRGLTKRFGATIAVDDISFEVPAGSVTGLVGANGAGKSTTLRMVVGLIRPDGGSATIAGRPYRHLDDPAGTVGVVLDGAGFHPGRSARDHLGVYAAANSYPRGRVDEVLKLVGLDGQAARRRVGDFSLGMRQRLALATALLGRPRALIADEPANGLDPAGIAWLRHLLRRLADHGAAVLLSSHALGELSQVAERVVVVDHGRAIAEGTPDKLARSARPAVSVRAPDPDRLAAALAEARLDGVAVEWLGPQHLRVIGVDADQIGRVAHRAQVEIHELAVEANGLEAAFLALTGSPTETGAPKSRR